MLLYDVFLALPSSFHVALLKETLSTQDLAFAQKRILSYHRSLKNAQQSALLEKFIEHCAQSLTGIHHKPWLEIIFNYYADTTLHGLNDMALCHKLTEFFLCYLQHQTTALSIVHMGYTLIDKPIAFTAFIRYLKMREVEDERIIQSHLLQHFFRYHFITLDTPENPLAIVYQLLAGCAETSNLHVLAQNYRCEEPTFAMYALDGRRRDNLISAPIHIDPIKFECHENNLHALHALFGIHYLSNTLIQGVQQPHYRLDIVIEQFNDPNVIQCQLPELLNQLYNQPVLLTCLASLLTDDTLSVLVNRHVTGVNSLIPYRPALMQIIQSQDFSRYIQGICQHASSNIVLIPNLVVLFEQIKRQQDGLARIVLHAIIDTMLETPIVFDDELLIQKLRKYASIKEVIQQKANALEALLSDIFQQQTLIQDMDYITIEDIWRNVVKKIHYLQEITAFTPHCPQDKYALYRHLARVFFVNSRTHFSLDALRSTFGIEPELIESSVTPYQRFLVELLASIDDIGLRHQIVTILDEKITPCWRVTLYNENNLYQHAARHGNLGLIQWLDDAHLKLRVNKAALAIDAAEHHQWHVVVHFLHHAQLNKNQIECLLFDAVKQSVSDMIQYFSRLPSKKLPYRTIEKAFKQAGLNQDFPMIEAFLSHFKLSDSIITFVFKQAIQNQAFPLAKRITKHHQSKLLEEAIGDALFYAARHNQCDVLTFLSQIDAEFFTHQQVENALYAAARAHQLEAVNLLSQFSVFTPSANAIKLARKEFPKSEPLSIHLSSIPQAELGEKISSPVKKRRIHLEPAGVMKRTQSCHVISAFQQHGFFKPIEELTSQPKVLKRQLSF